MLGLSVGRPLARRASDHHGYSVDRKYQVTLRIRTLPPPFSSENTQDDSLATADGGDTQSLAVSVIQWSVEQPGDHIDAASLDFTESRILLDIDEVLVEIGHHELLRLLLHVGGDKGGEIERWATIEEQFIVNETGSDTRVHFVFPELKARDTCAGRGRTIDAVEEVRRTTKWR
jgi:hypothetical protein